MHEQMYVEVLTPRHPRSRYPLVLIHGAAQTATNWMGTPDGRPGWADYFVGQGYTVYMVDQPARGRSPWLPEVDGKLATFTAEQIESRFTAPQAFTLWPQAKLHSQWPGSGRIGDPAFDAFYATQVPYLADNVQTQRLNQHAAAALLDRIGPAIILTHSQSGPFGWLIADARPKLVKAVVAVEPAGPPFQNTVFGTEKARAWGVADIPITYDPPVNDPADLKIEQQAQPDGPDLVPCWQQQAPARRLANLANVPALVVTAEASLSCRLRSLYRQVSDAGRGEGHCVAPWRSWHSWQRTHDHAGEEQSASRRLNRRMARPYHPGALKEHSALICRVTCSACKSYLVETPPRTVAAGLATGRHFSRVSPACEISA